MHASGRAARRALEEARETVARVLGALPEEVVFTSGGTEANNLAVFGLAGAIGGGHVVCSPIEHPAVSEAVRALENEREFRVSRPGVGSDGVVDTGGFVHAIEEGTRLAALMLANNETGALQPVAEVAALAAERGVPLHTDAVQAVGRVAVDFRALGAATMAVSVHKCHGPVGVGALVVRKGVTLSPRLYGGGQQGGRRPGTPAVALAVGMAAALGKWEREGGERVSRWRRQRAMLVSGLLEGEAGVVIQSPREEDRCLPQTLNVGFAGLSGDVLLMQLDLAGVGVSLGAACSSGTTQPSATMVAMGVPAERLRSSVRFSFGARTTDDEVRRAVEVVCRVARGLKGT